MSRFITKPLPGEATVSVQTMANGVPVGGEVVVVGTASMSVVRYQVARNRSSGSALDLSGLIKKYGDDRFRRC